jgi:RecA/RadA recombinase
MAKKKAEELEKVADDLIAGLDDTLKEIKGLDLADADTDIPCVSTGIDLLDEVMGGGIPQGKLLAMTGSAGSGKSTAAVQYIVGFQKANPKSLGIYIDVEQAISMKRLIELGCDPHRTKLISKNVTMEDISSIVQGVIKYKITNKMTDVPYLVIWDSESVTPTKKSLEVTESSKVMGEHSRTLGFIMNQLIPLIAKANVTLVVIQQLRDKISQNPYEVRFDLNYGSNQKATGGSVMQYYPFNLCRTRNKGDLDYDMMGIRGFKTEMTFIKNKNFAPKVPVQVVLDYATGYSDFWTKENLIRECKGFTSGPKTSLINYKDFKFSRREIKNLYETDETFREKFEELYTKFKKEIQTNNPWDKNLQIKKAKEVDSDLSEDEQDLLATIDSMNSTSVGEELNLDNL